MLLNNRTKEIMLNSFQVAKGYYKARFLESFNPIYWINIIIFLPQKILKYIGMNENTSFRIANVILTFFYWVSGFAFTLYKSQIKHFIITLISQL